MKLGALTADLDRACARWDARDGTGRLWARDASLWTGADEADWLGWLDAPRASEAELDGFRALADGLRAEGVAHLVLLGMGGSSLCPDVLARSLRAAPGAPALHVLDSTVPSRVRSVQAAIDPERTALVIASKSGGTIEPNMSLRVLRAQLEAVLGARTAAARCIAITDPGSSLEALAREAGFRAIAHGTPSIGGRFSALSCFGMLPAALAGLDTDGLLARARSMAEACRPGPPAAQNPGVVLGLALATAARAGRDKLTLVTSPPVGALGVWLEQLVAESSGKGGSGIVPVDGEAPSPAEAFGDDRVIVQTRLAAAPAPEQDAAVDALEAAGVPVVRIDADDPLDLGAEFFRWEIATAVACAELGVNPFDQPDVDAAKLAARERMASADDGGARSGTLRDSSFSIDCDSALADSLAGADLDATLAAHLGRLRPGDYLALNVYLETTPALDAALQHLRSAVRNRKRVATTLGYGPRFLHSTGQLHKGGPDSAVVLQISTADPEDVAIPGEHFGFAALKQAQADGDFAVLCERGRRALHVHAECEPLDAVERLRAGIERALRAG